jgi:hypothetical protein
MKHLAKFESFSPSEDVFTAEDMVSYISSLETDENDVPDYYFDLIRKANAKFVIKTLNIEELLKSDVALKDYVDSGEDRYEDSEYPPHASELENPIVVFEGEVIDGYNRTSINYRNGEKTIRAYVSI